MSTHKQELPPLEEEQGDLDEDWMPSPEGRVTATFNGVPMQFVHDHFFVSFDRDQSELLDPWYLGFYPPVSKWPDEDPDGPKVDLSPDEKTVPIMEKDTDDPNTRRYVPRIGVGYEIDIRVEIDPYGEEDPDERP